MRSKKIKIICTLGPNSLNKNFLKFTRNKISLLRLNMSHLSLKNLKKSIKFIRKFTKTPICIDTEGAQVRTKVNNEKIIKLGQKIIIKNRNSNFKFYPEKIFNQIKINDILSVGFDNLKIKVIKIKNKILTCKSISSGKFENNKGVHLENRKIKLDFLTPKDFEAIKIGKKLNIKYYALSFTNSFEDIIKFNKLLKTENKIFKIETSSAIRNFKKFLKNGDQFLIDRGDLSKEVKIENIPEVLVKSNLDKDFFKRRTDINLLFSESKIQRSLLKNNLFLLPIIIIIFILKSIYHLISPNLKPIIRNLINMAN